MADFHYFSSEPFEFIYNTGPITASAAIMFNTSCKCFRYFNAVLFVDVYCVMWNKTFSPLNQLSFFVIRCAIIIWLLREYRMTT